MTLIMPDGLKWLAWVAGTAWPEGDEDACWDVAEAWKTASAEIEALLAGIDEAKATTVAAYPQGEGGTAMGSRYDLLRTGDQSVEALAELMRTISDSAFDMGTEIQATKITVIVTLVWLALEILWAWVFPPTAPAVEAAAITTTRSFLKVFEDFVQKIITSIAARLGAPTVKRHFWSQAVRLKPVLPTAKGYGVYGARAIEAAAIVGAINGGVQVGQIADGKRRHFNGKEFGLSVLAGVAGMIPGREVGRYLGKGIDKVAGKQLNNAPGRVGRGIVIGGVSGGVGTAFGNLAVGAATGDWSSFASGAGWTGGIARGAALGGARGGFALGTPIPPGRGDIRSYVWMPKPAAGGTGGPPVTDGSSTSSSSGAGVAPPRPGSEFSGGSVAGTYSGRGDGGSSSGSSSSGSSVRGDGASGHGPRPGTPESVYHDASSGPAPRPGTPETVYHDAASTVAGSPTGSTPSFVTAASQPVAFTGRPPTSFESSVDGWGPTGQPPQGNTGLVGGGQVPLPVGSPPPIPVGIEPLTPDSAAHHRAGADEPFLGEGKDLRGKPRPKQVPSVEPLPGPYEPPPAGASESSDWAGAGPAPVEADVDVPFTL
ncbi:WXG100-like domain-containing protein [Nocardia fluminea]|uniref:WXG100-like domain-containing protein n=1 Tax=Nocardia fluminea TaxID=134984 RepID=UPI000C70A468|nr:hypothetical protein [Nocardia fluminea]